VLANHTGSVGFAQLAAAAAAATDIVMVIDMSQYC